MTFEGDYPEYVLGGSVRIVRAKGTPCPVCGHPTGDCTGDELSDIDMIGKGGRMAPANSVYVEEDVLKEVQITPQTKTKIIVAHAGTYISQEKAKEIGLL